MTWVNFETIGGTRGGRVTVTAPDQSNIQLAKLFAKMFIARPELMAQQNSRGEYRPLRGRPFRKSDILSHISGENTYGHYTTDSDNNTKLFCFDIDLRKKAELPIMKNGNGQFIMFKQSEPREIWGSRKPGAARDFMKTQLKTLGASLASAINKELEIPTAVAYSGSKGVHVYGFTGKTSAQMAREGARIVLDSLIDSPMGHWQLERGNNFYGFRANTDKDQRDPAFNFSQFELEVYPKQDSVDNKEKGLGNLLRLPCGVNLHSPKRDRAFFLDLRTALNEFTPRNPVEALTVTNQWR